MSADRLAGLANAAERIKVYVWLLSFLKPYRKQASIFVALGVAVIFIEALLPQFLRYFIDSIVPQRNMAAFRVAIPVCFVTVWLMIAANAARNRLRHTLQEKAARDIQLAMFSQLRRLGYVYYERNQAGGLLSLMNTEVAAAQSLYRRYLPELIAQSIFLAVTFAFMLAASPRLTVVFIPCLALYYALGAAFEKKAALWGVQAAQLREETNRKLYDSLSAQLELRVYGKTDWDAERFEQVNQTYNRARLHSQIHVQLTGIMRAVAMYAGAVGVFVYGMVLLDKGQVQLGAFIAFNFYYFMTVLSMTHVVTMLTEQRVLYAQIRKIYDFYFSKPDYPEPVHAASIVNAGGDIELRAVTFGYPGHPAVLNNVSLHIPGGQKTAIVGASGSGKSTLLKLLGRLYEPDRGEIIIGGQSVSALSPGALRDELGFVLQETYLFGDSVAANIRFGRPEATDDEIVAAAKAAEAHDFIMAMPDGYSTLVGERGYKLSGGQKQRLAIARMLVKRPRIVLLDEATSALDRVTELKVQQAMLDWCGGSTVIAVAHRLSTVRAFDRIIVMHRGEIIESGTYEQLMRLKGRYYKFEWAEAEKEGEPE